MLDRLVRLGRTLANEGLDAALRQVISRFSNAYNEWHLGIDTTYFMSPEELGFSDMQAHAYSPSDYYGLKKALRLLRKEIEGRGFLDFGCGMGRALS